MNFFNFWKDVFSKDKVTFKCLQCKTEENIPRKIVTIMDFLDKGNQDFPPIFSCERCMGQMIPIEYTNYKGVEYSFKKDKKKF